MENNMNSNLDTSSSKFNLVQQIEKLYGLEFIDDMKRNELLNKCDNNQIEIVIDEMWKIIDEVNGMKS